MGSEYISKQDISVDETSILSLIWIPYCTGITIPWYERFRIGGEIMLPAFTVGVYFNLGEAVDFLLGIFGIDIFGDDD